MRSFYRKRKIILAFLIVVGILSLSSVTYAIFTVTTSQSGTNEISTMKCLELAFSNQENNINLVNTYPMTDERGAKNTPYTFTITNNCEAYIEYSIGLMIDDANTLEDKYVKTMFSLKDDIGEAILLTNREEGKVYNDNKTYLFRRDGLANGASKEYKLRLWVDGSGTAETVTNKSFNSKIIINAYPKSEEGKINISTNLDGGHLYQELNEVYREGDKVKLPIPAKEGHSFKAWEVISGDGTINEGILTVGSEDITIKATYKVGITVTLDLDGGSSNQVFNSLYYEEDKITLEEPTKDGYFFAGWEVTSGDGIINDNTLTIGKESNIVKAKFYLLSQEFLYDYTGEEQTFVAPKTAYYKVETWGAQGGSGSSETYYGGYGGYSAGIIKLNKGDILYINVGGKGNNGTTQTANKNAGGYNGGGDTYGTASKNVGSGGGATHIAKKSGLLSSLSTSINDIVIVSGGGGGAGNEETWSSTGGSGGGITGMNGTTTSSTYTQVGVGGSQTSGGSTYQGTAAFGQGASATADSVGGGGGFYGGGSGKYTCGGGGGSGYIGHSLLQNKAMYCYNCTVSNAENTKTKSTTCTNSVATANCAKIGNGYAKIKQVVSDYKVNYGKTFATQYFTAPITGTYKIELWGAQGGNATIDSYSATGGKGGYTSGNIFLNIGETLLVEVGEAYNGVSENHCYNGGGRGSISTSETILNANGGGATDVRLTSSLNSRIMVAAGGGGSIASSGWNNNGGAGGGLIGSNGIVKKTGTENLSASLGGTQIPDTSGNSYGGTFGMGGSRTPQTGQWTYSPGGGGGYYGGGAGRSASAVVSTAGGGSSFISGYAGVNAITSETDQTPANQTLHYSGKYFTNGQMTAGTNSGHGKAQISLLNTSSTPNRTNPQLNNVRYVRDCINGNNKNYSNHWVELQIIKDGMNIAKGILPTGISSAYPERPLSWITDGDITTKNWVDTSYSETTTTSRLQCLTIDLGDIFNVDEIAVWHYFGNSDRSYNNHSLKVSSDNNNWVTIIDNVSGVVETSTGIRVNAYS